MDSSSSPPPPQKRRRTHHRGPHTTPRVPLNARQCETAWRSLKDPYVAAPVEEIVNRLLAGDGIVATRGGARLHASPGFHTYLTRDMEPYVQDAMRCYLALGLVPVQLVRDPTLGLGAHELVPRVPRHGTYTIVTWSEAGAQRFAFHWGSNCQPYVGMGAGGGGGGGHPLNRGGGLLVCDGHGGFGGAEDDGGGGDGTEDRSVHIISGLGHDPSLDGTLNSPLAAVAGKLHLLRELERLALTAENIAARPPLITGFNAAVERNADAKLADGFFVGDAQSCERRARVSYERNARQRAALQEQMLAVAAEKGLDVDEVYGVRLDALPDAPLDYLPASGVDHRGHEMPWVARHDLEAERVLLPHTPARARGDLVPLMLRVAHDVAAVLRVPVSVVTGEHETRGGTELAHGALHATVRRYATLMERQMNYVYAHSLGWRHIADELRSRVHRRRRALNTPFAPADTLLTEKDLFEARELTHVRLAFDLAPGADRDTLTFMWAAGVLDYDEYADALLRHADMPASARGAARRDPLSADDRKQLLGIKPVAAPAATAASGKRPNGGGGGGGGAAAAGTKRAKKSLTHGDDNE